MLNNKDFPADLHFKELFIPSLYPILDNLMEGYQIFDKDLKYIYINKAAEQQNRRSSAELIGKKYTDCWPGIEQTEVYKLIRKCLLEQVSQNLQTEFDFPDGTKGWFEVKIQSVPMGVFVLSYDISNQKRTEFALRESEEKYRLISENSDDWIYFTGPNGIAKFISPSCKRITGYLPVEFCHFNEMMEHIILPADLKEWHHHREKQLENPKDDHLIFRITTRTGELRWIEHQCSPVFNISGEYLGIRGTNRDITEKKKAELVLEQKHFLLTSLINSMGDTLLFSVDKNYCYTAFNEMYRSEIKRLRDKDIQIGMNLLEVAVMPDIRENIKKSIDRALLGEGFSEVHFRKYVSAYFEFDWSPVIHSGEVVGVTVLIRNITEKRQIMEQLLETKELAENSNKEKSDILNKLNESQRTAGIGSWDWDLINNQIWWSDELFEIFGLSPVDYRPNHSENLKLIHPEDRFFYKQEIDKAIQLKSDLNIDFRILAKNGTKKYCNSRGKVKINEKGLPIRMVGTISDITDRKIADEALRESESRFRKIYDEGPFGMAMVNSNFKFQMVNAKLCELLGYTEDELKTKTFGDITYPIDIERNIQNVQKLIHKENQVYKTEKRYIRKDGSILWASLTVTSNFNEKGEFLYNLAIIEDITKRVYTQEALKKLSERFELATKASRIGIWDWDIPSDKIVWDKQMFNLYGYANQEFPPAFQSWLNGVHPEDREGSNAITQFAINNHQNYDTEFRVVWPNGEIHWLKAMGQVFYDEQDKPLRMIGINFDITNQKEAAAAIEESERNFRLLIEKLSVPLVYLNLQGEFIFRNERFEKVFGYTEFDVPDIEAWWEKAYPNPEYRNFLIQKWTESIESALKNSTDIAPDEYYVHCKDGTVRTIIISGILINNHILVTLTDITDRKNAEQEIIKLNASLEKRVEERTQQLLAANKELEAFSYSVSHDLRAPLRGINGFTRILLEDHLNQLNEEGQRVCHIIQENSLKMGQLIDDLLAFSRLSRADISMSEINMANMVMSLFLELTNEEQRQHISFKLDNISTASGDSVMIKQVWTNLLTNAIKYSSKAEKTDIHVYSYKETGKVVFVVQDKGVGFDMNYVDKLFGVFQRLHSSRDFEGTGVGLAIVQRIILRHGGEVWARGEPGKGASFYFSLPDILTAN